MLNNQTQDLLTPCYLHTRNCVIVDDRLIHRFQYGQGGLQEGMIFNSEIFYRLESFSIDNLDRMHQVIDSAVVKGISVCISCCDLLCTVWVSLHRSEDNRMILASKHLLRPSAHCGD